jgi:hypothetical protein
MFSQTQFAPGGSTNSSRMISYVAEYNARFPDAQIPCACINNKYDKNVLGSDSPSTNVSYNARVSQIIRFSRGGKTQYGNFYLGKPLQLNYLGRNEGMPGGGGKPPLNKF